MTVFDDFKKLKKTGLPQLTVLYGEDNDILSALKEQLFSLVSYDASNLSQSYFDLADGSTDKNFALEELESLPFFDDNRLVIFENLTNLTTAKKNVFDEKQMKQFERLLDAPVETTQLVIICHGKLDNRLKLVKKLKKIALLFEATELKPQELLQHFSGELPAALLQKVFEKSAFAYGTIVQNLALLKTYGAGKPVSVEDIEKVLPKSLQDNIFELTDLVFKRQIHQARALVADLTLQGTDVIQILAVLTNSYQLYTQVKLMQGKGLSEKEQTEKLKIHPYRVKLANQLVRRQSKKVLKHSLSALIELDYQIKTGLADKNYLFDLALIKLTDA